MYPLQYNDPGNQSGREHLRNVSFNNFVGNWTSIYRQKDRHTHTHRQAHRQTIRDIEREGRREWAGKREGGGRERELPFFK